MMMMMMMSKMRKLTIVYVCLISIWLISGCMGHDSDKDRYLAAHNGPRAEVGVEPMCWNETLADFARYYTSKLAENCEVFEHSMHPEYGECLAEGGAFMTPEFVVQMWVDEKKFYDHANNKCVGGECGHYTQVVWRNTKEVGCAEAKCANPEGWYVASCNYYPSGNVIGECPY